MRRRAWGLLGFATAVCALIALPVAPATSVNHNQQSFIVLASGRAVANEAELYDAEIAGRTMQYSESLSRSAGIAAWQNDFAVAATTVEETFPQSFVEARIAEDGAATLTFAGAAPDNLNQLLAGLPVDVIVHYGKAFSAKQVDAATQAAHVAAMAELDSSWDVVTVPDPVTGHISVQVSPAPGSTARVQPIRKDALATVTNAAARKHSRQIRVDIVVAERGGGGDEILYGGGHLTSCTAAFAVSGPGYAQSLLTADHCTGTQNYGTTILTKRGGHYGANGDVQWRSTSTQGTTYNFYYAPGQSDRSKQQPTQFRAPVSARTAKPARMTAIKCTPTGCAQKPNVG